MRATENTQHFRKRPILELDLKTIWLIISIKLMSNNIVIIISPHLDDAVFNCWSTISQANACVLTLFAGVPKPGTTKLWDLVCGEPSGQLMMENRRVENDQALAPSGRPPINLDFLDYQYQRNRVALTKIVESVLAKTDNRSTFMVPLAGSHLWNHPDHRLAREVGIELLKLGRGVDFYPDSPYMHLPPSPDHRFSGFVSENTKDLASFIRRLF